MSALSGPAVANNGAVTGLPGFVEAHGRWTPQQYAAAGELAKLIADEQLDLVRVGFTDPHGLVRSKCLSAKVFGEALHAGMDCSAFPFISDTGGDLVVDLFAPGAGVGIADLEGSSDIIIVPDPLTFRILPWTTARTGWILCDEYSKSGEPLSLSPRAALKAQLDRLAQRAQSLVIGLEIEWHLTRLTDQPLQTDDIGGFGRPGSPPTVVPVNVGYQFNSDLLNDAVAGIVEPLCATLRELGLPLRSAEHESGPGQLEFTFEPMDALAAADAAVLFRTAVKQICWRHGYHASFMCKPALQGFDPSGWHLHQSLKDQQSGENLFMSTDPDQLLSTVAADYVGGLVHHARESSLLTAPTVNGYQRYRDEHTLSPSVAGWSKDNRGAMIRVLGAPWDSSSHIENRIGEPAANPYLYIASQVIAGIDGMDNHLDPGAMTSDPHHHDGPAIATTFEDAVDGLDGSMLYRQHLGDHLVDMLLRMKRNEWKRFGGTRTEHATIANDVTDWEQREYFRFF
jgi:glutamine synthetase